MNGTGQAMNRSSIAPETCHCCVGSYLTNAMEEQDTNTDVEYLKEMARGFLKLQYLRAASLRVMSGPSEYLLSLPISARFRTIFHLHWFSGKKNPTLSMSAS